MQGIKKLFYYIWQHPDLAIGSLLTTIVGTICYSISPYFTSWFTNIATHQLFNQLPQAIILLALALFSTAIFITIGRHLSGVLSAITSKNILLDVISHLHSLDFAFHSNKDSGKILALINRGDDAIYIFLDVFFLRLVELIVGFIVIIFSLSKFNYKYLILVFSFIIIEIIICYFLVRLNLRRRSEMNEADNKLSTAKVNNLINFETVKYFAQEKFELKKLNRIAEKTRITIVNFFWSLSYISLATDLGNFLFVTITAICLAIDLMSGQINASQFVFIFTFAIGLNWRINSFVDATRQIAKKYEDLNKYLGILNEKIEVREPSRPKKLNKITGRIQFKNVSYAYIDNKNTDAIKDFNLTIDPGEVIAVVGRSGAGKSTITKLLMRMFDVDSGEISIDGLNIKKMSKEYLRHLVRIVPQEPMLFNSTIAENIAYAKPHATAKEIESAAKAAGAHDFISKMPLGYQSLIGERGVKLSGGQKQRLAIARMILADPKIVILDEATSSLDSVSEKIVQNAFWNLVRGKKQSSAISKNKYKSQKSSSTKTSTRRHISGIIIAHRLSTVRHANRIVVLDHGQIAEIGTHEQLLRRQHSIYKEMWYLQQKGFEENSP